MLRKRARASNENSASVVSDANASRILITGARPRTSLRYGVISTTNLTIHVSHAGRFMANLPTRRAASLETNLVMQMRSKWIII